MSEWQQAGEGEGGGGEGRDWQDRAIDAALHELSGQRPPDLSARVLVALGERPAGDLPALREANTAPRAGSRLLIAVALLLVGMAFAFAIGPLLRPDVPVRSGTRLEVHVASGSLRYQHASSDGLPGGLPGGSPADEHVRIDAGETKAVAPRAGDRLHVARATRLKIAAFPTLRAEQPTEMRIQSMEITMKNGVVAASSLTVGVVAGMVIWNSINGPVVASPGDVVRLEAEHDTASLQTENSQLLARIRELEQQNEQLLAVREKAPEPSVPDDPAVEAEPVVAEPVAAVAMIAADEYADALANVDWALMGKTTLEMQPLMAELVRAMQEDGEVSPELAIKIQQLNANLLGQVPDLLEAGLPGSGANGAYTHPIVVSNVLANTLQAAGQPLDAAQTTALEGLVRSFGVELDSVEGARYEFDAEKLLREVETKERFYAEMSSRLTPEQFATIFPEGTTELDGVSLFGTGLMTRQFVNAIPAKDASEFARRTGSRLGEELQLDEGNTKKLRSIIESMTANAPELWRHPGTATERNLHMLRRGRTDAALRHQIAVLREISRQIPLNEQQRQTLANLQRVLVPLPQ